VEASGGRGLPAWRLVAGGLLVLAYALPLFWPPGPASTAVPPDASLVQRLFPGVPPAWTVLRLAALAVAAVLLSAPRLPGPRSPLARIATTPLAGLPMRVLALVLAVAGAAAAAWAERLPPTAQLAYLAGLFVPAAVLALGARRTDRGRLDAADAVAVVVVVVAWVALRLAGDLGSPRVADAVDAWRDVVAAARFVVQGRNLLTDLIEPEMPGVAAMPFVFQNVPAAQLGLAEVGVRLLQLGQIAWMAVAAAGIALLARMLVGRGVAAVAAATFLFAPYTRLTTLAPLPFLVGPLYAVALALAALGVARRESEAAAALLGPLAGIAIGYPGVVPVVALFGALTPWLLWRTGRRLWAGWAASLAGFVAAVVPALANVLSVTRLGGHLRLHGTVELLDPGLLGQLPLGVFEQARAAIRWRPLDVVVGALLEPFANARLAIRLWGDAILDPLGAALLAVGLVTAVRALRRRDRTAPFLLAFYLLALAPAFVSPVDRVDIVHAVAFPVPAVLLAAAAFAGLRRALPWPAARRWAAPVVALLAAVGGSVLFDVVSPRILSASAPGVLFRALAPADADRVVVLDYPPGSSPDVRWLFVGPMTAFGGPRPVGFLPWAGGELPLDDLAHEGKDLLAWSPGLEADLHATDAICRRRPDAVLYEAWDEARLGRVLLARLDGVEWTPRLPAARWRRTSCAAR